MYMHIHVLYNMYSNILLHKLYMYICTYIILLIHTLYIHTAGITLPNYSTVLIHVCNV